MRKSRDDRGVRPDADAAVDAAAGSSGQSLPGDLRTRFESSLGADLSSVRVHTGPASATAADSVGARAYAIGNDIHFADGQYDPTSASGQHLIAHEVAHTVQQSGRPAVRQHKLEVSTSGDASEVEADRAAGAMVAGESFAISSASVHVAREEAPAGEPTEAPAEPDAGAADKQWAEETRAKIQSVQAAALAAQGRLNSDADTAIKALNTARTSFDEFDRRFEGALQSFTSKVAKALAQMADLREKRKILIDAAMGAIGGPFVMIKAVTDVLAQIEDIAKVLDIPGAGGGGGGGGTPGAQSDWKALLGTAIDSFSGYLRQNASLTAITERCTTSEQFLDGVVEGKAPEGARSSAEGQQADKIGQASGSASGQLASINAGACSADAQAFAADATTRLETVSATKMEQDIAIQWLGGLTKEEFEQIDDCADYLRQLGVFDEAANRLGVDTGLMVNDDDEELIALRARIESEAMGHVGGTYPWIGMTMDLGAGGIAGEITAGGRTWNATGPRTLARYGGSVQVASYRIGELGPESTTDRVSNAEREAILYASVTFSVQPVGGVGQCPVEREVPDADAESKQAAAETEQAYQDGMAGMDEEDESLMSEEPTSSQP